MSDSVPSDPQELDERKATILRSVVSGYIETAQPVGSAHVAETAGLGVSAATVRNEMAALEEEGYLVQPHTSAGRIPTDKGYRFFVDHLGVTEDVVDRNRQTVRRYLARAHGELERLLAESSQLVSELTSYASVVVGPEHDTATVRSAQLVYLGPRSILALLVLSDGAVVKKIVEVETEVCESDVEAASDAWRASVVGRAASSLATPFLGGSSETIPEASAKTSVLGQAASTALASALAEADTERLFVGGTSKMASCFDAIETVRSVLSILEQHILVVSLLRSALDGDARLGVAIGSEHGVEPLADCSVVVAPYRFGGGELGLIGVLGPTRMHYDRAMATVAAVGAELESRLGEG
jgi:heat-inducible transcriptional repressor